LAKAKPEFSETITRARLRVEACRVEDLIHPDTHNANGIKFDLTNNYDWKEAAVNVNMTDVETIAKKVGAVVLRFVPKEKSDECINALSEIFTHKTNE
jgi:hypothetical protein